MATEDVQNNATGNTEVNADVQTESTPVNDESVIQLGGQDETPKDESVIQLEEQNETEAGEETEKTDETEVNDMTGSPEAYEAFELPQGFGMDEALTQETNELFKKLNLSQKGGQELINAYTKKIIAMKEAEVNALAEERKNWRATLKNRPNFESERASVIKGINAVVKTPEAKALFTNSWLCDHPAIFDVFLEVGKLLGEDTPISKGAAVNGGDVNLLRFPQK